MAPTLLIVVAFAPGIFWLWYFARKSLYRPGPRRLLVFTFLLGMVATIPAGILNSIFVDEAVLSEDARLASVAMMMLLVVGPVEETAKFLAVRLFSYRSLYFDEPADGLLYAAAASLGFASLENLLYVLEFGPGVMILRAPLSTLAHVVFASVWGYRLGLRTQGGDRRRGPLLVAILAAAAVHGLFNVAVFAVPAAAVLLVVVGAAWTLRRFDWARRVSPFRYRRNYPRVECTTCSGRIRVTSRYCQFCGTPVRPPHRVLLCGNCGGQNQPSASYCTLCGDQLLA